MSTYVYRGYGVEPAPKGYVVDKGGEVVSQGTDIKSLDAAYDWIDRRVRAERTAGSKEKNGR